MIEADRNVATVINITSFSDLGHIYIVIKYVTFALKVDFFTQKI